MERMRRKRRAGRQEDVLTCPPFALRANCSRVGSGNAKTFSEQNI